MAGLIWIVQVSCAGQERYQSEGGALATLYGELLGMRRYDPGYIKLAQATGSGPEIGFEDGGGAGDPRPRWPDPEYPQQLHLDIEVGDLDAAESMALGLGATPLQDRGEYRVYADPVGHPFCLYLEPALNDRAEGPLPGRIARIVLDCFGPRALAGFYEELMDMPSRVLDSPERVVIARDDDTLPMLAFRHVPQYVAPRWPDPAYPAQMHLDIRFDDPVAAQAKAERLGAIRLPAMGGSSVVYADPAAHPFCLSMEPISPDTRR